MSDSRASDERFVLHSMNIDDAYRVEKLLARGPGGVTELVSLDGAGPFVRKKMPAKLAHRDVWSILPECACPRLPRLLATYETPDWYAVVYEHVSGSTLEELVERGGGFDAAGAARMVRDVCEAVSALHAKGIVHRDLAPKNILISADGVHVIDLGIARSLATPPSRETTALGTHGFAAPEQYGFADTDVRSDVYSLGCLLGYAITGLAPGEQGSADVMADRRRVPASIASIVGRACSFEPSARYQSAGQMADELSVALGETPCPQASGAHTRLSSPAFTQQMPSASSRLSPDRGDAGSRGSISPAVSPEGAHGGSGVSSSSDPKRSAKSRSAESGAWKRTLARVFGVIAVFFLLSVCFLMFLAYLSQR